MHNVHTACHSLIRLTFEHHVYKFIPVAVGRYIFPGKIAQLQLYECEAANHRW
jgi:hypothetical protein